MKTTPRTIGPPNQAARKRFLEKISIGDDCWLWQGAVNNQGYGVFGFGVGNILAHRFSWRLFRGEIPDGKHVLHACDRPCCCRPDHLFLGTHEDNMRDMAEKGRRNPLVGSKHPRAKLNESKVIEIITAYDSGGVSHRGLAARYEVSRWVIWRVLHRKSWRHVIGGTPRTMERRCGSRIPNAKLNEAKVIEIRNDYEKYGVSQRKLAVRYGVCQRAIWRVLNREGWRHVV